LPTVRLASKVTDNSGTIPLANMIVIFSYEPSGTTNKKQIGTSKTGPRGRAIFNAVNFPLGTYDFFSDFAGVPGQYNAASTKQLNVKI
jgi:hypothetical protein